MTAWLRETASGVSIAVLVAPRASRTAVAGPVADRLRIRVAAPPVEGAANDELTRFLARTLRLPRAAVTVTAGAAGRRKTILAEGIGAQAALRLLSA
ncbi:MAG TPA: DUF167 family protein [Gemmatimonadales bacterium]|nr:DUF167 family protein [Gemmatimonadales bacterium]